MIVELVCNVFFGVAGFILSVIPAFPSFEKLNASLSPIFYVLKLINMFVSVKAAGVCCLIVLVVYNIKFIWSICMWLIRKIPGVS